MKLSLRAVLALISTIGLLPVNSGEPIYFLVGEPPGRALCRDSYVLPLSKQEDIDHARYLISLGRSVFEDPTKMALVGARVWSGKRWYQPELRRFHIPGMVLACRRIPWIQ